MFFSRKREQRMFQAFAGMYNEFKLVYFILCVFLFLFLFLFFILFYFIWSFLGTLEFLVFIFFYEKLFNFY